MNKKYVLGIVIIIIVVIAIVWKSQPRDTSDIKIGFIGPLSGDAASYGEAIKNGVDLAVIDINKAGGIDGRLVKMIYEDGKCNGKDSATAAQKLVTVDQVGYIIGGVCSGEVFTQIPITEGAKVLSLSPSASAAKLSGISKYFFRNNPSDTITGSTLADYLAKNYKTVAILSERTDYSQGIKENFIAEAQKQGLTVVDNEDFASDITDFRSLLSKIKAKNPDVIFINPQTPASIVRIATQSRQLGIKAQFANGGVGAGDLMLKAGVVADGMILTDIGALTSDKGKAFTAKYTDAYKATSSFPFYSGAAYDDLYLITQGIATVGDDATKVSDYLRTLKDYVGTIGTYSFDQNGDLIGAGVVLQRIQNGKIVEIQ